MIAFLQNDQEDDDDIPLEYRRISKNQLYASLVNEYLLPPALSKGVNKRYLVNVATHAVFRLNLMEFKRFEITLLPRHWKKQAWVNLSVLFRKVSTLLAERQLPPIGFNENCTPDESWLIKIIRYLDQENMLETFHEQALNAQPANCLTRQVHMAKIEAQHYLFGDNAALRTPKVIAMLKDINDIGRKVRNRRADIQDLDRQRNSVHAKLGEEEAALKTQITNVALLLLNIGGQVDEDSIFIEGDQPRQNRQNLQEIQRL